MYKIEGGFDFYKELAKDSDEVNCEETTCLISHEPLEETHVVLECGHKFNYDAIYNDAFNHKRKFNLKERIQLEPEQLRCPYCRNIQNKLLPYLEGKTYCYGINTLDASNVIYCTRILVSGKNKGRFCGNKTFRDNLCKRHWNFEPLGSKT